MKLLLILFIIIGASCSFVDSMHGGKNGKIEQVPYMAMLYEVFETGQYIFCGAAILSEVWILTAAHCIKRPNNLSISQVQVQTQANLVEEGIFHNISRIILHKKYSADNRWISDIALIELAKPIKLDEKSQTISISKKSPKFGDVLTISGYGDDYESYGEFLKLGQQTVISQRMCRKAYKKVPQGNVTIDDRVFCTDSTTLDLCGGDSGSPGVLNGKLVGVAVEGCESPSPNIYVNIAHYYDWIVKITGLKFE